jgi:hypothetical protein
MPAASSGGETAEPSGEIASTAKDGYKAFYSQTQAQFDLWIRPNASNPSPAVSIPYSRRMNMTHDDGGWFLIIMHFDSGPILSVRLHGRDMEELFMKLLGHEAIYVREFDPRKWPEVPAGEACITGIDIRYRQPHDKDPVTADEAEALKPSTH